MACLDLDTLDQLVAGELDEAALMAADVHLDECPPCRRELANRARRSESLESLGTSPTHGPASATVTAALAALASPADDASGDDPFVGRLLAERYRVIRRLGGGGMGTVYEAEHALLGRRVALKVLHPQFAANRDVVRRFQNEAHAAATLGHPNILEALDMGRTEEGLPFLVLELLVGHDLDVIIEEGGPLAINRAVRIAIDVAGALATAHAAGIVHRDLKPENVFVTEDEVVKVLDFGISKITSTLGAGGMTGPGQMMGTPHYMAPEQFEDAASADPRSDVYALGVLLYRALSGSLPFSATSLPQLLLKIVGSQPPNLTDTVPSIPVELSDVIRRAMAAAPEDRFPSMDAFRTAVEPFRNLRTQPASTRARPDERLVVTVLVAAGAANEAAAQVARAAVEGAGGRVEIMAGGELLGVFGEKTWQGDELRRALDAALEIRQHAEAVAVCAGHVVREGGRTHGEPIDRALLSCDAGLAGVGVVGTIPSRGYVARRVTEDLREVSRREGPAWSIFPTPHRGSTQLFGRDAEVAQLRTAVERAMDEGHLSRVLVTGAAGLGKTRLTAELLTAIEERGDFSVLVGRAMPGPSGPAGRLGLLTGAITARARWATRVRGWPSVGPEAPLEERRNAVHRLAAEAFDGPEATELAAFLGEVVGVPMPSSTPLTAARSNPRLMADRIELAVREYLLGLADRGPVALLLEDLHWADAGSLTVLKEFVEFASDRPVLVFGTARDELDAPPAAFAGPEAVHIGLRGLGLAAVRSLVSAFLGGRADADLARQLHQHTGGTPFFLEQILEALADTKPLGVGHRDLPLPPTVEAAIQARLDVLNEEERELLKRGAVLGGVFRAEDIESLSPSPSADVVRALDELTRRGLLRRRPARDPGGVLGLEFSTSLVADVVYRLMTDEARTRLHLSVARILGARGIVDPETLAIHLDHGGAHAEASRAYVRAALGASRHKDVDIVMRCSDRALQLGLAEEDRFPLHLVRAEALETQGHLDAQEPELKQALAAASSPEERAAGLTARGVWTLRTQKPADAIAVLMEAAETASQAADPTGAARALGCLATALVYAGRLDEAAGHLAEAERLVMTRAPALRADAAIWRAQLAGAQGDLGARRNAYAAAEELYAETGDLRSAAGAAVNLADAFNRFGAYALAEAALTSAVTRCQRLRMQLMEGYAHLNLGYAQSMILGRADDAGVSLETAFAFAAETGDARLGLFARLYLARLAVMTGDHEGAVAAADSVVKEADLLEIPAVRVLAHTAAAAALLALGKPDEALTHTTVAMAERDEMGGIEEGEAELFVAHVDALTVKGRFEEAAGCSRDGQRLIQDTAKRISDPAWRQRFLTDVTAHRTLLGT